MTEIKQISYVQDAVGTYNETSETNKYLRNQLSIPPRVANHNVNTTSKSMLIFSRIPNPSNGTAAAAASDASDTND